MTVFPSAEWCRVTPSDADFDSEKLAKAVAWLDGESGEGGYRLAIVKGGRLVLESRRGFAATEACPLRLLRSHSTATSWGLRFRKT